MSKPNLLVARTATDDTTEDTTDGSAANPNTEAAEAGVLEGVAALLRATIAVSVAPSMRRTMSARRLLN